MSQNSGVRPFHSAACAVAAKVKDGIRAYRRSVGVVGQDRMADRQGYRSPIVALLTVRQAPTPPKMRSTISCSKCALTGPKLVNRPDASIAFNSETNPLSRAGDGLSNGIFKIAA